MKKVFMLVCTAVSLCICMHSAVAQESNMAYLGFQQVGLNEACVNDIDCQSEWCKTISDTEKKCAAKLTDNSPCSEHRECQSFYCDIPQGGSDKICIRPKIYADLDDPCTKDEDCASGWCRDYDNGRACALRITPGRVCEGEFQNYCRNFYTCDPEMTICVTEDRPNGGPCITDKYCKSHYCIHESYREGECGQVEDGYSCKEDANCFSGWCKKTDTKGACKDDNKDATACCEPRIEPGQACTKFKCTDGERCDYCTDGYQCDSTSQKCVPETQKLNGSECTKDEDCASGWCKKSSGEKHVCSAKLPKRANCEGYENYCGISDYRQLKCDPDTHRCK